MIQNITKLVSNQKIYQIYFHLQFLLSLSLPGYLKYIIFQNLQNINPLIKEIDEIKNNIILNHGGYRDPNSSEIRIIDEQYEFIKLEVEELLQLSQYVTISCIYIDNFLEQQFFSLDEIINFCDIISPEEKDKKFVQLTNEKIYNYSIELSKVYDTVFQETNLPFRMGFYLNINRKMLLELGQSIETEKIKILEQYEGIFNKDSGQYLIPSKNIYKAQQKLDKLSRTVQNVDIYQINIDTKPYEQIKVTHKQIEILMPMLMSINIQRSKRIMKLTNTQIYNYANNLFRAFNDGDQKLPIKISFYLQKNKNTLLQLAQDIEASRIEIAKTYGTFDEETSQYIIPAEKMEEANKELNDLFNLEQDVQIYTINIDNLSDDITITTAQMEAIMFMIEQ